jgi:hypothetical protein
LVQEDMVGVDRRGTPVRAIPHAARDVVAVDCKSVDVLDHAHAAAHVAHERKPLAEVRRREKRGRVSEAPCARRPARRRVEQRERRRTARTYCTRQAKGAARCPRAPRPLLRPGRRLEERLRRPAIITPGSVHPGIGKGRSSAPVAITTRAA